MVIKRVGLISQWMRELKFNIKLDKEYLKNLTKA